MNKMNKKKNEIKFYYDKIFNCFETGDNRYIPGMPWDEKEALKGKNESWAHFFRRKSLLLSFEM